MGQKGPPDGPSWELARRILGEERVAGREDKSAREPA